MIKHTTPTQQRTIDSVELVTLQPRGSRPLTLKTKRLLTSLPFAAECIRRGAIVSEPLGDDARYDMIVDSGGRLLRANVKSAYLENLVFIVLMDGAAI